LAKDSRAEVRVLDQRLQELESLKEKGLVTDEEYQAMRKKALGL